MRKTPRRVGTMMAAMILALAAFYATAARAEAPDLIPAPKEMRGGEGRWVFPTDRGAALPPGAGPVGTYGAQVLAGDLRTHLGFRLSVREDAKSLQDAFFVIGSLDSLTTASEILSEEAMQALADMPDDQGFVIETITATPSGRPLPRQVWIVGAGGPGALNGALTVSQMLERSGGDVLIPAPLFIADWPSVEIRGYAWFTSDSTTLDWMARSRMNAP